MKNTLKYTLLTLALVISAPTMAKKSSPTKEVTNKTVTTQQQVIKVNLNSASAEMLSQGLNGIGLRKAHAIVSYRKANGPFKSIEELAQVKGIGIATIEKNMKVMTL